MRKFSIALVIAMSLIKAPSCVAQAPPTISQALAANGIGSSIEDLRRALHNENPNIRGMAAMQLADDKDLASIPAIQDQASREHNPLAELNLAKALINLNDSFGRKIMAKLCRNRSLPIDLRVNAANSLTNSSNACFSEMVGTLGSASTQSELLSILDYLNHAPTTLSRDLSSNLATKLEALLADHMPQIRQEAARCIAHFRLLEAVPSLRQAASKEEDPPTKRVLEHAEHKLVKPE